MSVTRQFKRKLLLESLKEHVMDALGDLEESPVRPDPNDDIWNMFVELELRIELELSNINEAIDLATG